MPGRPKEPEDEREAWLRELREHREAGTLSEVLQPNAQAFERMLREARKERVSADRRRR